MAKVKFFKGLGQNLPKTGLTPGSYYQVEGSGKLYYAYNATNKYQIGSELEHLTVQNDATVYGHLRTRFIDSEDENGLYLSGNGYNVESDEYPFWIDNMDNNIYIGYNGSSVDMSSSSNVKLPSGKWSIGGTTVTTTGDKLNYCNTLIDNVQNQLNKRPAMYCSATDGELQFIHSEYVVKPEIVAFTINSHYSAGHEGEMSKSSGLFVITPRHNPAAPFMCMEYNSTPVALTDGSTHKLVYLNVGDMTGSSGNGEEIRSWTEVKYSVRLATTGQSTTMQSYNTITWVKLEK